MIKHTDKGNLRKERCYVLIVPEYSPTSLESYVGRGLMQPGPLYMKSERRERRTFKSFHFLCSQSFMLSKTFVHGVVTPPGKLNLF